MAATVDEQIRILDGQIAYRDASMWLESVENDAEKYGAWLESEKLPSLPAEFSRALREVASGLQSMKRDLSTKLEELSEFAPKKGRKK